MRNDMAETLLEKAQRLNIQPAGTPRLQDVSLSVPSSPPVSIGETLLEKAKRLNITPENPPKEPPKTFLPETVRPSPSVLAQYPRALAEAVNVAYEGYTRLPVVKQAGQAIGGVTALGGGVIGGTVGAIGTPIANLIQGRPAFEGMGKEIIETAVKTGKFGFQIGQAAAPAAPLGIAGRLPALVLAYGQGYSGAEDLLEGVKEKDEAQAFEGAVSLGTALIAATAGVRAKGVLLNSEVAAQIRKLPAQAREAAIQRQFNSTVEAYRDVLNQTASEVRQEFQAHKDNPLFLAREGIIPQSRGGRFHTEQQVQQLEQRQQPIIQQLDEALQSRPEVQFDLNELRRQAKSDIRKQKLVAAQDKEEMMDSIDEFIDAEIRERNPNLLETTNLEEGAYLIDPVDFNLVKQRAWQKAYNPNKTAVANSAVFSAGHKGKEMIEQAFPDENVRGLNQEIGNYATAIRFLKKIEGRKIRGGVVGNWLARGTGAIVGAITGGLPGAALGTQLAGKTAQFLRRPEVRLGTEQKKLEILRGKK